MEKLLEKKEKTTMENTNQYMKNEVILKRVIPYGNRLPMDIYDESIANIGSFFDKKTNEAARGLPSGSEEEKKIMPLVVDIPYSDPSFQKEVRAYWQNIIISVPADGKTLNASILPNGMPENPRDYVMAKFVKKHPHVFTPDQNPVFSPTHAKFIITSEREEMEKKLAKKKREDAIRKAYIKTNENEEVITWVLDVMRDKHDKNVNLMSLDEKSLEYENMYVNYPELFYSIVNDENLQAKAFISKMIDAEILTPVGNDTYYGNEKIADSEKALVLWFNDKKNESIIAKMKSRYEKEIS